ncbi:MAG: hypothetical protein QOI95_2079 [Acidimicrobiaceae bacterium]|jgi:AcrR family transcriptional regulator
MPKVSDAHQQARRQQILSGAAACFARDGFHRTTMPDIFRETGLSPGAVYRYFNGKEQIVEAIAEERRAGEAFLLDVAFEGQTDLREALSAFLGPLLRWLAAPDEQAYRRVGIQVWAEALRNERILEIVRRAMTQRAVAVDLMRAAQADGHLSAELDPDALARVIIAMIQGFILQQSWEPDLDANSYIKAVESIVRLIVERPGSSSRPPTNRAPAKKQHNAKR